MRLFCTVRLLPFLICALLASCVTTQKGGFEKASSDDEIISTKVHLAIQYLQKREFAAAKAQLKSALEYDPRSPDVHDALGHTFLASGETELAEKHYRKAVSYGDGGSRYRVNYANFLFRMEQFEAAEKQLEYVVDDSLYEKRESALMLLGMTQLQMLETDKARSSFERALVLNPRNQRVLRELAILEFEGQEFERAWRYLQQYREVTARASPEMLLLGIQLATALGREDDKQSYILALKNLYPDSREYSSYLRELEHNKSAK